MTNAVFGELEFIDCATEPDYEFTNSEEYYLETK